MRAALALAGVAFAAVAAGCILVTGGTDGYSGPEAGPPCQLATDCKGQVCCGTQDDAGVPSATCQATCPVASQQLCSTASDCGDGGQCLTQSCTSAGTTVQVMTCGAISGCH